MFDVATENDVEDDAINILTCRYECYIQGLTGSNAAVAVAGVCGCGWL